MRAIKSPKQCPGRSGRTGYLKFLEDGGRGVYHEYMLTRGGGRRLYRSNVAGLREALKKLTGESRWKCSGCQKWRATRRGQRCAGCARK